MRAASGAGVTRFDGHEFVNYTMADGLPDPVANHVFTDSHGRTWIATNGGGLAMFRVQPDTHGRLFDVMSVGRSRRSNRVNKLIEAHGRMWAATDEGLFRAEVTDAPPTFSDVPLDVEDPSAIEVSVFDLTPGDTGSIWLAMRALDRARFCCWRISGHAGRFRLRGGRWTCPTSGRGTSSTRSTASAGSLRSNARPAARTAAAPP